MGRQRKPLIEKSTSIMLRIDNKTLFNLCEKNNISIDWDAEIFPDDAKKHIISIIKENISKF